MYQPVTTTRENSMMWAGGHRVSLGSVSWAFVRERYFTLDLRSLGLFRIAFGSLLCCELLYRARGIDTWYTNAGLMPNHVVLWAKPQGPLFSFFFTLSSYQEALWGFVFCGLVFAAYTVGYRTRLSQLLALLCIVSLNSRLHMLENGGDIVVNILACLTAFLPLGDRFSLDALRARSRRLPQTPTAQGFVSVACFALLLQLAVIYLFNVLHKTGASWRDGTAVHYTLHQDRLVTSLGVWMRETLPAEALQYLTWGTLLIESLAVVLILTPFATSACRALAALLLPLLHLGFALSLDLGPFPYVMMCFFVLLVPALVWEQAAAWRWLTWVRGCVARLQQRVASADASPRTNPPDVAWTWPRETAASLVLLAILFAVSQHNAAVPAALRPAYPTFARSIVDSARLYQGWRMFAPEAPFEDFAIAVDAVTADGRHVDPYNEIASPNHPQLLESIPKQLGQDQYFTSYSLFLPNDHFKSYRHILQNWILAYPERTGRPEDRIVSFEVLQIVDTSPPPGFTQPSNVRRNRIMSYPEDATEVASR